MLKKLLLLILFINFIYADVLMDSQSKFYTGDAVVFTLEANGRNIEFPNINNVDGFSVSKNGSSSSLSIINGRRTQKLLQQYKFFPNKTVTIPSFKILIDGKDFYTKEKLITNVKVKKTQSDFLDYEIFVSSKKLYVGEQTIFTLKFKYRRDLQIVNLRYTPPSFDGFWSKQMGESKKYEDGLYVVQELKYVLFPQKSGRINIPALKMNISLVDSQSSNVSFFGPPTKAERIYSNELNLDIKKLPKNVFLIGDFTISNQIDKETLNAGEALNFEIEIEGRGNIDDIPELQLDIPNATIYANKATKIYDMINGQYGGTYKKSFSIVANEDIIIPHVLLNYFDKKQNKIIQLKTKQYNIKVKSNILNSNVLQLDKEKMLSSQAVEKKIKIVYTSDNQKILYFFFGFLFSSLIIGLIYYVIKFKEQTSHIETSLEKEIKQTQGINDLLNSLLSYINIDKDLDKMIFILESNKNLNFKQTKKDILKIIKDKNIQN